MKKKQQLGQFNTTKKDYILKGFAEYVKDKKWIDPFAGQGDLLEWVQQHGAKSVEGYDIDARKKQWDTRDTLLEPLDYFDYWSIANPPYLALNKNKDKTLYQKYELDDLYKIAIKTICENGIKGGIFIVPLNFLCSEQARDIRDLFYPHFQIIKCKVFEESVFDDTDYTVCAFYYKRREQRAKADDITVDFMRDGKCHKTIDFHISEKYGWILGEDFYKWLNGTTTKGVVRWTVENMPVENGRNDDCRDRNKVCVNDFPKNRKSEEKESKRFVFKVKQKGSTITKFADGIDRQAAEDKLKEQCPDCKVLSGYHTSFEYYKPEAINNIILIEAIDTGTKDGMIGLKDIRQEAPSWHKPLLAGLPTSRNKAHVKFDDLPTKENQLRIIEYVNDKLVYFREKYNSVFLTAFRNSTAECSRKRIGFDVMYKMINKARQELGI